MDTMYYPEIYDDHYFDNNDNNNYKDTKPLKYDSSHGFNLYNMMLFGPQIVSPKMMLYQ